MQPRLSTNIQLSLCVFTALTTGACTVAPSTPQSASVPVQASIDGPAAGDTVTLRQALTIRPETARAFFAADGAGPVNCYVEVNHVAPAGAKEATVEPGAFTVTSVRQHSYPVQFDRLPASGWGGDNDISYLHAWYSIDLAENDADVRAIHCVGEYSFPEQARYASFEDLRAQAGDALSL